MKEIFNGLKYRIVIMEDYLTDMEIKYMASFVRRKEVKKVKPYFEMKVVKVGKPKPKLFMCKACGTILPAEKPKGNWVNSENLDKIKFPCFCSYMYGNKKSYGEINEIWDDIKYLNVYTITDITKQTQGISIKYQYKSLKDMILNRRIHILKGKIILYEEE